MNLFNSEEFMKEPRFAPIFILLDCSKSMKKYKDTVEKAIKYLFDSLAKEKNIKFNYKVCLITYNHDEAKVLLPLTDCDKIDSLEIEYDGKTPFGKGIEKLLEILNDKEIINRKKCYSPVLINVTDGRPTNAYKTILKKFLTNKVVKQCDRFGIDITKYKDSSERVVQQSIELFVYPTKNYIYVSKDEINKLVDAFKFLSLAITSKSKSKKKNKAMEKEELEIISTKCDIERDIDLSMSDEITFDDENVTKLLDEIDLFLN